MPADIDQVQLSRMEFQQNSPAGLRELLQYRFGGAADVITAIPIGSETYDRVEALLREAVSANIDQQWRKCHTSPAQIHWNGFLLIRDHSAGVVS